jgi:hypothetical protein
MSVAGNTAFTAFGLRPEGRDLASVFCFDLDMGLFFVLDFTGIGFFSLVLARN